MSKPSWWWVSVRRPLPDIFGNFGFFGLFILEGPEPVEGETQEEFWRKYPVLVSSGVSLDHEIAFLPIPEDVLAIIPEDQRNKKLSWEEGQVLDDLLDKYVKATIHAKRANSSSEAGSE